MADFILCQITAKPTRIDSRFLLLGSDLPRRALRRESFVRIVKVCLLRMLRRLLERQADLKMRKDGWSDGCIGQDLRRGLNGDTFYTKIHLSRL